MAPAMVVKRYFDRLAELLHGTTVTIREGKPLNSRERSRGGRDMTG
jgi:hypothetical protein